MVGHISRLSGLVIAIIGLGIAYLTYGLLFYVYSPEGRLLLNIMELERPCFDAAVFRLHHSLAHGLSILGSLVLGVSGILRLVGVRRAWVSVGITTAALIAIPLTFRAISRDSGSFWEYDLFTYLLLMVLLLFAKVMHRATRQHA